MRALVCCVLVGCASGPMPPASWVAEPEYYSIAEGGARVPRYSRVDEYVAYGANSLGAQARISDAYAAAQHEPPPSNDPILFHEELPPGIRIDGDTVRVDPRAPYEPIGRFAIEYRLEAAPDEPDVVDDIKRLASATRGDAIVLRIDHVADADARVHEMTGIVLRRRAPAIAVAPAPNRRKVKLAYSASPSCLSRDELAHAIETRLGYSPWDAAAPIELRAEITSAGRGFQARLQIGDSTRQLAATSCRGLGDALVAIAVIQLEGPG
jgi:hypothetical protein